ncbi:hypothetical protein D0T85_22190, partial [Bacteroides sp. 519]|nr:hypothetical protein [Bacteroides sp. 519]
NPDIVIKPEKIPNILFYLLNDNLIFNYATGAAACSTFDLLLVLESINTGLDNIRKFVGSTTQMVKTAG